jgi:hypothetical protein
MTIGESLRVMIEERLWRNRVADALDTYVNPIDALGMGLVAKTAVSPSAYAARTVTGTAGRITVTNGNGASGNPTLDLDSGFVSNTPSIYARNGTFGRVQNTVTETAILSAGISAGLINSSRAFRVTIIGQETNSTGGAVTMTLRLKYGSSVLALSYGCASASNQAYKIEAIIGAQGTTTAAQNAMIACWGSAAAAAGMSFGVFGENAANPLTLSVTAQWPSATNNLDWQVYHQLVEYL